MRDFEGTLGQDPSIAWWRVPICNIVDELSPDYEQTRLITYVPAFSGGLPELLCFQVNTFLNLTAYCGLRLTGLRAYSLRAYGLQLTTT